MNWKLIYFDLGFAPFCWRFGDQRLGSIRNGELIKRGPYTMFAVGPFRISWRRFASLKATYGGPPC